MFGDGVLLRISVVWTLSCLFLVFRLLGFLLPREATLRVVDFAGGFCMEVTDYFGCFKDICSAVGLGSRGEGIWDQGDLGDIPRWI